MFSHVLILRITSFIHDPVGLVDIFLDTEIHCRVLLGMTEKLIHTQPFYGPLGFCLGLPG